MEEWRPALGYEGIYAVSNQGRVRRLHSPTNRSKNDGILSPGLARNGYLRVVLCREGVRRNFSVHRLVLEAFKRPFRSGEVTNHIDGVKRNNGLGNLEQVMQKENDTKARRLGLTKPGCPPHPQGSSHSQAKLCDDKVQHIRALAQETNLTHGELGQRFGVCRTTISLIVARRTWRHI